MITLIHGDDNQASRKELINLKDKYPDREIRELGGKSLDMTQLIQALESTSLFGAQKLVVIENLFGGGGKRTKAREELISKVISVSRDMDIVIWEDREITQSAYNLLGSGISVRLYKVPRIMFQFLDSVRPGVTGPLLKQFIQLCGSDAPELVYTMLSRRVRQLIMIKDGVMPDSLAGWQAGKLTGQAKFFTLDKLLTLYKRLLDIEVQQRSGLSPFNIKEQLELLLSEI